MMAVPARRFVLFGTLAAAGCSLDLATKSWIFARLGIPPDPPCLWVVPDVLSLTTSLNEGALFGIAQGRGSLISLGSGVALIGILFWLFVFGAARDRLLTIAVAMITGGILGNLYDRLGLPGLTWFATPHHAAGDPVYAVRDWIHFRIEGVVDWPVFNIADSLLVVGAILLVVHAWWFEPRRAKAVSETATANPRANDV